jgi:hypothetical protein
MENININNEAGNLPAESPPEIKSKVLLLRMLNGWEIFTVDGAEVRQKNYQMNFTIAGHFAHKTAQDRFLIPPNEIWLEAKAGDKAALAAHELFECWATTVLGWGYDKADAEADRFEAVVRWGGEFPPDVERAGEIITLEKEMLKNKWILTI